VSGQDPSEGGKTGGNAQSQIFELSELNISDPWVLTEEIEMWKWDDTLDNKWFFLQEQIKGIIIISNVLTDAEHPHRHARRHQARTAGYELGEGNTRAEAIEA
jgi:hypothetical protein